MDNRLKVYVVMKAVESISGKRGRASLVKVLRGSQSFSISQTVKDFNLKDFWGIFSCLTSNEIDEILDMLCRKGFVYIGDVKSGRYKYPMLFIGDEGRALLAELDQSMSFSLKEFKRKWQDSLINLEMSEKGKKLYDFLKLLFSFINLWTKNKNLSLDMNELLDNSDYSYEDRIKIERFIFLITNEKFRKHWRNNKVFEITMHSLIKNFRLYLASIPELESSVFRLHFNVSDIFAKPLDDILDYYELPEVEICAVIKKLISRFDNKDINERFMFVRSLMSFINEISDESTSCEVPLIKGTVDITYDLFKEGLPLKEIARKRSLSLSTVYSHLAKIIPRYNIDIDKVIPPERVYAILNSVKDALKADDNSLKAIKSRLPSDFSYGEIKLVMELQESLEKL